MANHPGTSNSNVRFPPPESGTHRQTSATDFPTGHTNFDKSKAIPVNENLMTIRNDANSSFYPGVLNDLGASNLQPPESTTNMENVRENIEGSLANNSQRHKVRSYTASCNEPGPSHRNTTDLIRSRDLDLNRSYKINSPDVNPYRFPSDSSTGRTSHESNLQEDAVKINMYLQEIFAKYSLQEIIECMEGSLSSAANNYASSQIGATSHGSGLATDHRLRPALQYLTQGYGSARSKDHGSGQAAGGKKTEVPNIFDAFAGHTLRDIMKILDSLSSEESAALDKAFGWESTNSHNPDRAIQRHGATQARHWPGVGANARPSTLNVGGQLHGLGGIRLQNFPILKNTGFVLLHPEYIVNVKPSDMKVMADKGMKIWSDFCRRLGHSSACFYGSLCNFKDKDFCMYCDLFCLPRDTFGTFTHAEECQLNLALERCQEVANSRHLKNSRKNETCQLCKRVVPEMAPLAGRLYGILPNCDHILCLSCAESCRTDCGDQRKVILCRICCTVSPFFITSTYCIDKENKRDFVVSYVSNTKDMKCNFCTENSHSQILVGTNLCYHGRAIPTRTTSF